MYKTRRTQLLTSFIPSCKIMQRLWSSCTVFCVWVCACRGSIVRAKRQIASNDGPHQWQHKNLSFEQKREPSCGRYGTRHILECRRHIDYIVREDHTCMIYMYNTYMCEIYMRIIQMCEIRVMQKAAPLRTSWISGFYAYFYYFYVANQLSFAFLPT